MIISFSILLLLIVLGFAINKSNYSAINSFLVFSLIFYVITPIYTYSNDVTYWGFRPAGDIHSLYIFASWVCLISFVMTMLGYVVVNRKSNIAKLVYFRIPLLRYYLILSASILLQLMIYDFNIEVIFIRDSFISNPNFMTTSIGYLINLTLFKSIPSILFIYIYIVNKGEGYHRFHLFYLFFALLIVAPPSQIPRFLIAAYYLPIVYFLIRKYVRFVGFMFFSTLVIFPILDIFRLFANGLELNLTSLKNSFMGNFKFGHFDAFQSVMMAIEYDTHSWGYSFIGAILFFVPRVFWPSKPIGSGQMLANEMELVFNNIAMSLPGEFYLNFNISGVILLSFFFGCLMGFMDKIFSRSSPYMRVYSIIFVPLVFIIMRGDLFTGISFAVGLLFAVIFWYKILTLRFSRSFHECRKKSL